MLLFLPHCVQANEMAIRNNFIYYVQSSLGKKKYCWGSKTFYSLLLCLHVTCFSGIPESTDNLRGLIRVGKVSYKYFRQDCKLKQSLK